MARGTVFKRNGRYGIRVDLGPDPKTGKRRQSSRQGFRTKREAEAALDEALGSRREGTLVSRSSAAVGQYLEEWIAGEQFRLKETTWASYEIALSRIKRHLAHIKLQALTPLDVERA